MGRHAYLEGATLRASGIARNRRRATLGCALRLKIYVTVTSAPCSWNRKSQKTLEKRKEKKICLFGSCVMVHPFIDLLHLKVPLRALRKRGRGDSTVNKTKTADKHSRLKYMHSEQRSKLKIAKSSRDDKKNGPVNFNEKQSDPGWWRRRLSQMT